MKKKLLNLEKIDKICINCANGRHSPNGDVVLCTQKGVMDNYSSCKRFVYDPLNRTPARPMAKTEYKAEEFEL